MDGEARERGVPEVERRAVRGGSSAFRRRPRSSFVRGADVYDEEGLRQVWTLGAEDLELIAKARGDHNRLALGLLLACARAERRLISDPAALPSIVVAFVAGQLGVDVGVLADYRRRPATRSQHVAWVCAQLGVRPFRKADEERLVAFIAEKVAHTANSAALLDAAEDWLVREALLRPTGETTIERLVYGVRAGAEEQLLGSIAASFSEEEKARLDVLCTTDEGESALARLGRPARAPSASAIRERVSPPPGRASGPSRTRRLGSGHGQPSAAVGVGGAPGLGPAAAQLPTGQAPGARRCLPRRAGGGDHRRHRADVRRRGREALLPWRRRPGRGASPPG